MLSKWFENSVEANFKKRYYIFLLILFFFGLIIYLLAIQPTLELYKKANLIEAQYDILQQNPAEITQLKEKINNINKTRNFETSFVTTEIARYCAQNQLKVSYKNPNKKTQGNLEIETTIFEINGSFQNITKLAYFIERQKRLGNIVALHYEMKKNFETREMFLTGSIYLQSIKSINNE